MIEYIMDCKYCGQPVVRRLQVYRPCCFQCKMKQKDIYNLLHKKTIDAQKRAYRKLHRRKKVV